MKTTFASPFLLLKSRGARVTHPLSPKQGVLCPLLAGSIRHRAQLSSSHPLLKVETMELLGSLAFAGMTIVNLIVLGLVVIGIFRKTRIHH